MSDKIKATNIKEKKKVDEAELQAWLDAVHFGSCCSDPLDSSDNKKDNEFCHITKHDSIKK